MHENANKNSELLQEIVREYSVYNTPIGRLYFKHLDIFSFEKNLNIYFEICDNLKNQGILSEEDQINNAIDAGIWSLEKEKSIQPIKFAIKRMVETKKKLIYASDKRTIEKQIVEKKAELKKLIEERSKHISFSIEQIANQKAIDFYIKNYVYIDDNLSKKLFKTNEDFEYANPNLISTVSLLYANFLNRIGAVNIQKLALSNYFQNMLIISSSPKDVFGKSLFQLTKPQNDLLMWGKYFQNILKNLTEEVPEKLTEDPDKFIEWVKSLKEKNKQKTKQKRGKNDQGKSSKFLFGSGDEIKEMTGEKNISGNKILQESSQKGGLGMKELMDK